MDLDFKLDNNSRFIGRVSCILYNKDKSKVLLFKIDDKDFYMLPGGRILFGEDSKTAIEREMKEELGYNLNYEFINVQENFIKKDNVNIMQYCFCFKAIYEKDINYSIKCKDNKNQTFYWISINEIEKYNIVPRNNIKLILKNKL